MNDDFKRVHEKLEKVDSTLSSIDKTLALQELHLKEHIRRTALLETEMKPVVKHVNQMQGAAKLLGILALIATIVSVWAILK